MSKETKRITTTLHLPTTIEMVVSWDGDSETTVIHRAERTMTQADLTDRLIFENCDEDTIEYIDEITRKALGIEDE